MVYNRIAYDETNRKIGQNPRESWRMVPDSHPAIISWELFDEISALREAEQAVKEERKKWCRQRRKNNPNIFKGRIFCKKCGEKAEKEKELAVVQEELQRKKQIAGSTEVLLTADNLQQYVKKIEVDRGKITYTEFLL